MAPRHFGVLGFMCSAWRGQEHRPEGRWVDMNGLNRTREGQQSRSRGIEDVEQNAFDRLFNSRDGLYDRVREKSRTWLMSANNAIIPMLSSTASKQDACCRTPYGQEDLKTCSPRFQSQETSDLNQEYEIDPITNRKVLKNKTLETTRKPIEVPVKTFKGYRSQFQDVTPPPAMPTEPKNRHPVQEGLADFGRTTDDGPVVDRAPDSKLHEEPEEEPGSALKSPRGNAQENHFGTIQSQDQDSPREILKACEEEHPFGPLRNREPEGKLHDKPCPVQEGLKDYDSRVKYGPVLWDGSNGNPVVKPDLKVGEIRESTKRAHAPNWEIMEGERRRQEGLQAYDSRVISGPVIRNAQCEQPTTEPLTVADGLQYQNERVAYGPRTFLKKISLDERHCRLNKSWPYPIEDKEDLDLLRPSDVRAASGIVRGVKKETEAEKLTVRRNLEDAFQKQQDLYTSTCEDLSTANAIKFKLKPTFREGLMEDLKVENSELQNIQAHLRGKVNAELAKVSAVIRERKMTGNFVRDFPEEFETKWTSAQDSATLKPENEVTSEYLEPALPESFARNLNTPRIQTSLDRTAIDRKITNENARLQNEIDPSSKVSSGLEISSATERAEHAKLQNEPDPYSKGPIGRETSYATEVAEQRALGLDRDPYLKMPRGLEPSAAIDKAKENAVENKRDPFSKTPQGVETSDVQQVKLQNEEEPHSNKRMGLETNYVEEVAAQQAEGDLSVHVSSFGKYNDSEEDRRTRQLAKQEKMNRLKQKDKELIREIRSIYEEKYGMLDSKHRQIPETIVTRQSGPGEESQPDVMSVTETQEPTLYKILAYDPTMQEINTAETTSIVSDSATALTPAEVLLRLSNPAKFFPHFRPLQAEGYEIISGSGDVLVFRKVRPAGSREYKAEAVSTVQKVTRKTTNPIDGMQSSPVAATGNFASPTGFVNHDRPVSEPQFKSNIDVRREEPVFSGKSNWQEESESTRRKSKGRGKRLLVGAAWVAGCSYAIGVVAEFFRTGGIDGRGPQGF